MIEWSETDLLIRDSIREFIDAEIRPNIDALEDGSLPPYGIIRKFWQSFGAEEMARGAVKSMLEKERAKLGGRGPTDEDEAARKAEREDGPSPMAQSISMGAIAIAEMAGVALGVIASMGVHMGLCAGTIAQQGTLEQKERWLPGLATFDTIGAWAITEPDAGSDAFGGMRTTAKKVEGGYLLNGSKTFITNSPYADVIVTYAKLDDGSDTPLRDRPVLTIVLDGDMEGLTKGKPFKKMGLRSSPTGELFFDDVMVSEDRILHASTSTGGTDGRDSARANFAYERMGVAVLALGIVNECHRLCLDYAQTRTLWGQEIGRFQLIQAKLAEMEIARINLRNMVFDTIERVQSGKIPSIAEASAIKMYAARAATDVAMEAVQLFGGNGYMAEYRVEQLARDAKGLMIYAGSNEIMVTHIAKGLLGSKR